MDLRVRLTESQYEVLKTVAKASGDTPDKWLHTAVYRVLNLIWTYILEQAKPSKRSYTKRLAASMDEN